MLTFLMTKCDVIFGVFNHKWAWVYLSFKSFCNKEIEFPFESVQVHIWAVLTNKQPSNGRTTGKSTGNPTGDSTHIYWTTGDNSSN